MNLMQQHINNLDGFRGFAALLVVVSHYSNLTGVLGGVLGEGGGQAGVMLFFMLTGFLIARLHLGQEFTKSNLLEYAFKRVARVYPLFIIIAALPSFLSWSGFPGKIAMSDIASFSAYLGQITLIDRGYGVLWTIQIEFIFYIAFVAIWFAASKAGSAVIAASLLAITCLLVAGGLSYGYDFFNRCHYFVFGVVIAIFANSKPVSNSTRLKSVVGVLLLISVPVMFPKFSKIFLGLEVDSWRSYIVMVQFLFLFIIAVSDRYYLSAILSCRPLRWVGKVSYSLYLIHYFVLLPFLEWVPPVSSYAVNFVFFLSLTLLVSWLSYRFLERPLQKIFLVPIRSEIASGKVLESSR